MFSHSAAVNSPFRVRFAPSPTGLLHLGGARTALFNWLFARHHRGTFILRIEDTDRRRFQQDALEEIYSSLRWLGLDWDEGPERGGDYGPYVQSQRVEIYRQQAQALVDNGRAYRCFCSEERLAGLRAEQEKAKMTQGSGYDRRCRELSTTQIERHLQANLPFVIRLKIPENRQVAFEDLIRGSIVTDSQVLDDLVLLKSDGFPTYHLANVVDDHLMGISHVMRGDEWISSTPRHVLLYEAFGWESPRFAHLPIILAADGGKLSKRKGAASVMDYRRSGYLSEALFNFLALLGWAPGDDREVMNRRELVETFSLERISVKAAVFDDRKLEWMNGHYLSQTPVETLYDEVVKKWRQLGWIGLNDTQNLDYNRRVIDLLKSRSKRINELAENACYFFRDPQGYDEPATRKHFRPESGPVLTTLKGRIESLTSFDHDALEAVFRRYAEETGMPAGKLIHPVRLAVSGVSAGPGLFEMLELLGRDRVTRRLQAAIDWIARSSLKT